MDKVVLLSSIRIFCPDACWLRIMLFKNQFLSLPRRVITAHLGGDRVFNAPKDVTTWHTILACFDFRGAMRAASGLLVRRIITASLRKIIDGDLPWTGVSTALRAA